MAASVTTVFKVVIIEIGGMGGGVENIVCWSQPTLICKAKNTSSVSETTGEDDQVL